MKLDFFIPAFLKKIDIYLLKNYPNLWITNVHFVLFYTLILDGVLFFFSNLFGFSLTDAVPDVETPFMLMILPAILVFVFWFIKQARYNVDKNYGKSNLLHDYQNFAVYFVVIFMFYTVAAVIPHSLIYKVSSVVSVEELEEDIHTLNQGFVYFEGNYVTEEKDKIEISYRNNYVYQYRYYDELQSYDLESGSEQISKFNALLEIESFIAVYNKYSIAKITETPQEILTRSLNKVTTNLNLNNDYYYSSYRDEVDWKLQKMDLMHNGNYEFTFTNPDYLKVIFALIGMLALLTWIFKNVHWKNFLAAGVTVLLSPFIMALVGLILFVVLGVQNNFESESILIVILLFNLVSIIWFVVPYLQQRFSYMSVINGILLQVWTPFSIFAYTVMFISISYSNNYQDNYYYDYWEAWKWFVQNTYWIGWAVALLSIAYMKPFYKAMWAFPKPK